MCKEREREKKLMHNVVNNYEPLEVTVCADPGVNVQKGNENGIIDENSIYCLTR